MNHMNLISAFFTEDAAEHLLEAFAKVLGHQSVHDWVDAGVGVGHAVREEPEGVRGLIEREVSVQVAQDHHVVRQPAYAEQHGDNDDHFGDFALGPLGFWHAVQRVDRRPQVLDGPSVRETHDQHGDDVAKHEGARVQHLPVLLLPAGDTHGTVGIVDQVVVAEVRTREDQGKTPDDHHGNHRVTRGPELSGAQRVTDGQIPAETQNNTLTYHRRRGHDGGFFFCAFHQQFDHMKGASTSTLTV